MFRSTEVKVTQDRAHAFKFTIPGKWHSLNKCSIDELLE